MGSFSTSAQFFAGKALESACLSYTIASYSSLDRNIIQDEKNLTGSLQKDFFLYPITTYCCERKRNKTTLPQLRDVPSIRLDAQEKLRKILKDFQFAQILKISCCWGRRCRNPCKTKVRPKSGCSRQKDGRWLEKFSVIGKDSMDCVLTSR